MQMRIFYRIKSGCTGIPFRDLYSLVLESSYHCLPLAGETLPPASASRSRSSLRVQGVCTGVLSAEMSSSLL